MIAFYAALFVISWKMYYRWHAMKDLHHKHPAIDTLASLLPFLTAIIMFVSATGNMFVHAILWLQIGLVMVGITILRRTMGELRTFDIYLVRRPWRELAIEPRRGAMATPRTELHDTDH
jgi:predicted metal-dependent hydrolase